MATAKPRITVTLEPDVYETIKGLSEAQGCTMSGLVSEFLAMVNPVQQRVLRAIKKAQAINVESKASMVANLEQAEAQMTEMLGPLLALLDAVSDGQPPHSNTGVTHTNASGGDNIKTPRKARPVAVQAMRAENLNKIGEDRLKEAKAKAKIDYQSGYEPSKPAEPAAAPAAGK